MGGSLQGQVRRRLGRVPQTVFANEQRIGLVGVEAKLSRATRTCREWSSLSADERPAVRAHDGGLRGLRRARRRSLRASAGHARADRRVREHADHGRLRQRGLGRGRRDGVVQRDAVLEPGAGDLRGQPRAHRRAGRTVVLQRTTRGAGRTRATRRSGAGSARPTAAARRTRSFWRGGRGRRRAARSGRRSRT